jgi:hypothetical protein
MASYDLQQLIKLWEQEKLTTEQAIGQNLLQLKALSERISAVEKQQAQIRQTRSLQSGK